MSQQSDFADAIYQRLNNGPIPLADLIRTISFRWGPEHGASEINLFVLEAVTCLLQY